MSTSFEYLDQLFPGQLLLPVLDAGHVIGMAKQTVRNKVSDGVFPIPVHHMTGRVYVKKFDLADFIDGLGKSRPRRGRPPKVAPAAEVAA